MPDTFAAAVCGGALPPAAGGTGAPAAPAGAAGVAEQQTALGAGAASCDRGTVYRRIDGARPVVFRDRFTGGEHTPADSALRAFFEITAADELDVLAHNPGPAARYGAAVYGLFASSRELLSPAARDACARRLGRYAPAASPGSWITGSLIESSTCEDTAGTDRRRPRRRSGSPIGGASERTQCGA